MCFESGAFFRSGRWARARADNAMKTAKFRVAQNFLSDAMRYAANEKLSTARRTQHENKTKLSNKISGLAMAGREENVSLFAASELYNVLSCTRDRYGTGI